MRAPRKNNPKRTAAAVVASGVVSSLTALTVGLAPAGADPADPMVPPTPVVVAPAAPAVVAEAPVREAPPREAPSAPVVPVAPPAVIPVAPQAPVEPVAPPVVVAPSAPQTAELAPQLPAPKPVTVDPPAAPSSAPVATPRSVTPSVALAAPAESSEKAASPEPGPAPQPAETPESAAPVAPTSPEAPAPVLPELVPPSAELAPPSPAADAPSDPAGQSDNSDAAQAPSRTGGDEARSAVTAPPSEPAVAAAQVIKTEAPKTLAAPTEDVQAALSAKVVEEQPLPAAKLDVDAFASVVKSSGSSRDGRDGRDGNGPRDKDGPFGIAYRDSNRDNDFDRGRDGDRHDGDHRVRQWDSRWVAYDDYYRPVISNPYRQPVRIVYIYQNTPRIVIINPLARVVLDVAQYAAYSFTAVVANAADQAVDVAVGSFFGGGYYPGYGAPLPPPPPPLLRYDDVPVQVRYPQATYEPFRVQRIVDVGDDAQYGERKVLLDGVTPAWGEWTQTPTGERQFEVHKTQQFPGLDQPGTGPLPGDYQLRLASDEARPGIDAKSIYLEVVAGALAVMSLGALAWSVMLGRRRSQS
jgi:hypothetical protein